MRLLRLRILCLLLAMSLVPLSLLLAGLYWLPAGFLSFVWYGLLVVVVTAVAVGVSGHLAKPVRDLAAAFDQMMRTGGQHQPQSRWVPSEFGRVQRAFSLFLKDSRRDLESAEQSEQRHKQRLLEAERLLQQSFGIIQGMFQTGGDGVVVADRKGCIIATNGKLDEMMGMPTEHISGRDGGRLLADISSRIKAPEGFESMITQALEDSAFEGAIDVETDQENAQFWSVRTIPLRSETDEIIGRLWTVRDHTERRRMTEKLQQAQKMEAIGQLAGGIAHDFNNLLTAIRGNLALATMESSEKLGDVRDKLQGATRATVRAAELVKQLLGYSRKSTLALRATNLNTIVTEVENILRHSIDPRITVRSELVKDPWLTEADPVQIEQVILNICLNARDAASESGGVIEVSTENCKSEDISGRLKDGEALASGFVMVRIKDNGPGIPEEARDRIFEPFFSTKPAGKGTGLGLAMARAIVEEHGGWIEFDTETGRGTQFRIYLPRTHAESGASEISDTAGEEDVVSSENSGRILVVDDEAAVRSIAVSMLQYLGYQVVEAADGQQALDRVAEADAPFEAILLDIYMPKLSGRDTFKRLRASGCETPVVVCSGFMIDPDEFMALSEGNHEPLDVIQKPYSMEALAKVIAKAIAKGQPALAA